MRTFNSAFQQAVVTSDPIDVRFTIEVQWDDAGTELVYFLSHSDSGSPVGATTIHSIHSISSTSQSLNNRYAIAEIGSLNFTLADVGDAITTELASRFSADKTAVKKKCTVYMGTKDLDWTDYEPVDTWFIDDVEHTGPGYKFRASDVQRLIRHKIMAPDKTRLSASMTATQGHMPVTLALSSTKFPPVVHDANWAFNPSTTVAYSRVDDEIIAHDGTLFNHGTDGPSFTVIERGALNTRAAAHNTDDNADSDKGKEVEEVIYLEDEAVDLIHLALTGEDVSGSFTIPDHWNAGVDTAFMDSTSFSNINAELADRRYSFIGEKDVEAKQFVEQQCMRFYGMFQTVTSKGELKLNRNARTLEESAVVSEVKDISLTSISDIVQRSQDIVNVYSINYNYDYLSERFTRNLTWIDSDSINANGGLVKNETFEFRGVRTALHTDNDIRNFTYQNRELQSNPPYKTTVKGDRRHLGVEVGDVINVITAIRKDYVSGSTTLSRPFLVTRRNMDLGSGEMTFEVIGTGLAATAVLDPDAAGSTGELNNSWLTGTGTDLETHANVTDGTLTGDVTLTGGSDLNDPGSIWNLEGNLVVPTGTTLTLEGNVQLRVTGNIDIQNGGSFIAKANGHSGGVFGGGSISAGYFGSSKAGAGETQAPSPQWHADPSSGVVINWQTERSPFVGQVQSVPFFNIRNTNGELTGLPSDLRGTPGGPGGAMGTPASGNGGDGGAGGAGVITISRGFSIGANATVDLSGAAGTAGATDTVTTSSGNITFYAGGGGGGCPGGWLCIIDGDFSGPTSDQITADRGDCPFASPRSDNQTGFDSKDMAAAALRVQYVPAQKAVEDTGETAARQLAAVSGVSLSEEKLYALTDGTIEEKAVITWSALNDSAVEGYQVQAKRSTDPDWITQALTNGQDDITAEISVEGGVQYDVRVRAFGDAVTPSAWSDTFQFTPAGKGANPSDVLWFTIDGNTLRWGAVTDADLAGYKIRYRIGDNRTWSGASPIHNGLLTASPHTPSTLPAGLITLMIKAVDRSGNESTTAAVIVKNIGDPEISNIVLTQDEHGDGFTGTISGGTVNGSTGDLEADSTTQFYSDSTEDQFYSSDVDSQFYPDNVYEEMVYTFDIVPDEADEGAAMTLEYTITGETDIEFRNPFPFPMYSGNDSLPMYTDDADPMYTENEDWQGYAGPISASHDLYQFRTTTAGGSTQGVISELKINIDAEDIVEKFNDVEIASGGTRLSITKTYRQILNVTYGLQDDGGTAIAVKTVDKDPSSGPLVNCKDSSNSSVAGLVDAQIRGI